MALTREELREMGLTEEQVEHIIKGHTETVTGLTTERDRLSGELQKAQTSAQQAKTELQTALQTALGDAEKARNDLADYRKQVETERANAGRQTAIRKALREAGVQREDFVELLARTVDPATVEMDGDKIKDAAALIDPLKASYGGCFAVTQTQGVPPVNPPTSAPQKLTRDDVNRMSEQEILANWGAVQAAIGQK